MLASQADRPVYSVSELAHEARILIEERFDLVWVEGEISNFRRPASGHWYFTLKDRSAQVRCAMFAGRNRQVRFAPEDGMQVLIRGRVSLYEPRGDFQVIVEHAEPAGEGALRQAFEALKTKLAEEGLFAIERKRPLPALPRHLAIVSSASGAALQDVLHVIERRFPALTVTLLPVSVQGNEAEAQIRRALARVDQVGADVVLITRGGGSLEDLWAFNLESVARAVAACPIPTVVAVGHQTDFVIAEFVADLRAPTPSAAAELVTPDAAELAGRVGLLQQRLVRGLSADVRLRQALVGRLRAQLVDPRQMVTRSMQRADDLEERLRLALGNRLERNRNRLWALQRSLRAFRPEPLLRQQAARVTATRHALGKSLQRALAGSAERLGSAARTLDAVSPLHTLARGYAVLAEPAADGLGRPVTAIAQVAPGATIDAHLHDGRLRVEVVSVNEESALQAAQTHVEEH